MDSFWLAAVIILALVFDFLNGFNDSGSIVATVISTGAMSHRSALLLASVAEFIGPFIFGVAVAATVAQGIVDLRSVSVGVIFAALMGATLWNLASLYFAVPSSSTHALVGGLVGATLVALGPQAIQWEGLIKIFAWLVLAPVLGAVFGYVALKTTLFLSQSATPAANTLFKRVQLFALVGLALSHGTNDAQKTMGVITMSLVAFGLLPAFDVPLWVVALSAGFLALGVATSSLRIVRTLGARIYRIRPVTGFAAQASSAVAVLAAVSFGAPVSTSQVVGATIVGVGTAERKSRVRWEVADNIVTAWLLTLPSAAAGAALIYQILAFTTGQ